MTKRASETIRTVATLLLTATLAAPAIAQSRTSLPVDDRPVVSVRPFLLATGQQMAARTSFDAVFGRSFEPFWGGGVQVAFRDGLFVDLSGSRFRQTGERAFFSGSDAFRLGIPMTVTITPVEVNVGFRFHPAGRFVPYAGGGFGSYGYKQTSTFADDVENLNTRHVGYHVAGGVEVRLHRWLAVTGDVIYTDVPGILGTAGISSAATERNLGGVATRVRVIVGR